MGKNDEKPLIILGIKHSGKSTLGKYLSQMLEVPFFDLDSAIEKNVKMSVRQFYLENGEESFKNEEYKACKEIFENNSGSFVLATGGGICDNKKALNLLDGKRLMLDASEQVCFERILENAEKTGSYPAYIANKNPKNQEEARLIFSEFYNRRRNSYLKLADEIVEWV